MMREKLPVRPDRRHPARPLAGTSAVPSHLDASSERQYIAWLHSYQENSPGEPGLANSPSAEKRIRQERRRNLHNRAQRSRLKTAIRKVQTATDATEASEALKETSALLDRLASRRLIHPNKAARKKSQLARLVNTRQG